MGDKEKIVKSIEEKKEQYFQCSDTIWGHPELRFDVGKSSLVLQNLLEKEGFEVKAGLAGMDHAFVATYGDGKPIIGILAEYDALANLSQVADLPKREFLVENGNGHGCGHHALGTGAAAGAIGIKDFLLENKMSGTIRLYGCPAEEGGSGKAFMAREGIFDDVDVCLTWHPMDQSAAWSTSTLANYQIYFNFKGCAAHAAAAPEMGRSALDAVELMSVGVNYLREHIIDEARIHYAYIDAGGASPNVVQPTARVLYFIRAPKSSQVQGIFERVVKIAQGAALMTETEMEIEWDSAIANYIPNNVITKAAHQNMQKLFPLEYTKEELEYEKPFFDSIGEAGKQNVRKRAAALFSSMGEEKVKEVAESPMFAELLPYMESDKVMAGSTDVGDASWVVPTGQFTIACTPQGTPPHSWQWVATGKSDVFHKGMITAAKVIAMTAYDILKNPQLVEDAKKEHIKNLNGETYHCAIPADVSPR